MIDFPKIDVPELQHAGPPPIAFHFLVIFYGFAGLPFPNPLDIRFQSVSGLGVSFDGSQSTSRIGGSTRSLPTSPQYNNVTLERGFVIAESLIRKEIEFSFQALCNRARTVHIISLNQQSIPMASWLLFGAYPIRWNIGTLNADQSNVLIETMELTYSGFQSLSL